VLLTRRPAAVGQEDVARLRGEGWNDAAIHDAIQVVSYFNYINRIAEAVGVEDEPDWT
jgi:alkylhydroperoxidase family enzyme